MNLQQRTIQGSGGIAYLLIFLSGFYANFVVLEPLRSLGSELTWQQLLEQKQNLIWGALAFLLMLMADAWLIFVFYRLSHKAKCFTLLTAAMRAAHVLFFAIALLQLAAFLGNMQVFSQNQEWVEAWKVFIRGFDVWWAIGLIFFGAHLVLLAFSIPWPKVFSLLLVAAGAAYGLDALLFLFSPDVLATERESLLLALSIPAELMLMLFLLRKKVKMRLAD